jgi:hypothetical protein
MKGENEGEGKSHKLRFSLGEFEISFIFDKFFTTLACQIKAANQEQLKT